MQTVANSHLSYLIIATISLCVPPHTHTHTQRENVWLHHCPDVHVREIHQIWKTLYSMPQIKIIISQRSKRSCCPCTWIPAIQVHGSSSH